MKHSLSFRQSKKDVIVKHDVDRADVQLAPMAMVETENWQFQHKLLLFVVILQMAIEGPGCVLSPQRQPHVLQNAETH